MGFRAALSIALPLLAGSCAPAACGPTAPTPAAPPTTAPAPATAPAPPVASLYGWTLCIDSDGGTVTERQPGNNLVTYSFPGTKMSQAAVNTAIGDVRARYAEWGVTVKGGSCEQDNRSFTIYLTPDKAPAQAILAANWAGYAYIGGWGLTDPSGYNFGFVFTDYIGTPALGVYIAHEAGHGGGLDHPWQPERNIMYDPDPALGWSDAQRAVLASKFLNPPVGIIVDGRARPNSQGVTPEIG